MAARFASFRMASVRTIRLWLPLGLVMLAFAAITVSAESSIAVEEVGLMTSQQIEEKLQDCPVVEKLNLYKAATAPKTSSFTAQIFATLFPSSPAVNALLATLYISGPPNFLLALCPPNVDPNSLSMMVAFAVGGLLGDTIFHLLPEIFLGEEEPDQAKFILVDPNKNLLLGVAIIVGFMTFVAMDKTLRIVTGGGGGHDHSHSHPSDTPSAKSTGVPGSSDKELRHRKRDKKNAVSPTSTKQAPSTSIKLSAYLNLIADFTHNITDGLALSSSFYASPTLGATTTAAVFFHEIPHEVGDFALLIQSGFSKKRAMGAQFVTAVGAFLGTCIGIAIQELGKTSIDGDEAHLLKGRGLAGTDLQWGDLLLPFTAGTFLYVGTVAVIPELLETGQNKSEETWKTIKQFIAITAGAGIMLAISWS